jgi:virginiamycin B lyase
MIHYLWNKITHRHMRRLTVCAATPRLEVLEDRCLLTSSISEFPVTPGSFPFGITAGPNGNLWFTQVNSNQIGEIDPVMHVVSEYPIPTPQSGTIGITAGPDGNLWFAEAKANKIGKINPTTHVISEYAIPTANSSPGLIAAGPDGNLWFTEVDGNKIGKINPTTHAITEFPIPTANSQPAQIVAGPDGNLWFAENNTNQIGVFNLATDHITEFPLPTANSQPLSITAGPDGNLWYTEYNNYRIGSINPTTHHITEYPNPLNRPYALTVGPDGNIWFTEENNNSGDPNLAIGELNLATHVITENALRAYSDPGFIAAGPNGTLWFTDFSTGQIGEIQVTPLTATWLKPQSVEAGQTVTFTASAIGTPTPTVQWQVSAPGSSTFTPLSNGGIYSGVTTDTLTITNVTLAQNNNEYRAIFSNGNANTNAVTMAASLSVSPALSITPSLPAGMVGVNYNQTLTINGGIMPTFTVSVFNAGSTGLKASAIKITPAQSMPTRTPGTITIGGTPNAAGAATFIVHVTDSAGFTLTKTITIIILSPAAISNLTQTQWTVGRASFNGSMTIYGDTGPFQIASFTGLPTGMMPTLYGRTISFSGTPSVAKTYACSITIKDATGVSVTKTFSITINPPLQITTTSLPVLAIGAHYTATLQTSGGTEPVTFALATGNLPTGLTLSSNGQITGVSTSAGSFTFAIMAFDASGAMSVKRYTL